MNDNVKDNLNNVKDTVNNTVNKTNEKAENIVSEQQTTENVNSHENDEEQKPLNVDSDKNGKKKGNFFTKNKNDTKYDKMSAEIEDLKKKTEELTAQIAEEKDKYLRLFSEFDNYRKRTAKEKIELISIASSDLILKLLPVLDDLERAEKAMDDAKDVEAVKKGCELIISKFMTVLKGCGLEAIESTGQTFDADIHDAIANLPAQSEDRKNKIIDTTEKGYMLNGKIIRHAKVVVGN